MRILFLDTSSFFVSVAIVEDGKILFNFQDEIKSDMSSKIMPIIRDGFNSVDFECKDIDRIIVANGPGSFTGIRIGVTIAKTLAWSLKKDITTVSSLELMASGEYSSKYVIPMIDARRGFVYAGVYDNDLNVILENKYMNINDLDSYKNDATFVCYDNLEGSIVPNVNIIKLINKHINDEPINPHAVNPNYLKKTEAEMNLEMKNND